MEMTHGAMGSDGSSSGLKALLDDYERRLILEALSATGGHQRRTAALLGVLPTTLHEKMKRLGLLPRRRAELAVAPAPALGAPKHARSA